MLMVPATREEPVDRQEDAGPMMAQRIVVVLPDAGRRIIAGSSEPLAEE